MAHWPLPGWLKCLLISAVVTALLLAVYEWGVRYTWVGAMLNGRKQRKTVPGSPTGPAPSGMPG